MADPTRRVAYSREYVTAHIVGAEPVFGGGSLHSLFYIISYDVCLIVEYIRSSNGYNNYCKKQYQAQYSTLVLAELEPYSFERAALLIFLGSSFCCYDCFHSLAPHFTYWDLIRGSTKAYTISISRLAIVTNMVVMTNAPVTVGMSR